MTDSQELQTLLSHHNATEHYHRHQFTRCHYTDGVKTFVDNAGNGAYWLLDILLTEPAILQRMRTEGITFITLKAHDGKAVLTAYDDSGIPPYFNRAIAFTDCPDGEWKFFFGGDVLMLPGEY